MTADSARYLLRREAGRRVFGFVGEVFIKAYGAAAALSVAISDAETLKGKGHDAVAAIPNLMDRYRDAKYVVDHREEIETAVDYVQQHAPDPEQLEEAINKSSQTLVGIETTYSEVIQAKEAALDLQLREASGHVRDAWGAMPDLDSISRLADTAEKVSPFVKQVEVLIPAFYGGLLTVMDNFASDEVVATVGVMAAALGIALLFGAAVGFWARRGRPGLVARTLQRLGARVYRDWYVRNLDYALSRSLYSAARERIQSDIVANPETALDQDAFRRLEVYFEGRSAEDRLASSTSAHPPGARR